MINDEWQFIISFNIHHYLMMNYSIRQIADIIGGVFLNAPPLDCAIEHLLLDSRQVIFPANSLFIALQGRRHDGHDYLEDLYRKGVRNFILSKKTDPAAFPDANILWVENTHEAFHRLARFHRHRFSLPVVGITGSNGKTVVKEWLFQLLHEDYHIVRSPKSYNSQTGVPLSVLQITKQHTLGIFEAGITQPGEMEKLAAILDPGIGIFLNLGEAHNEGFVDLETKLREKLLLFKNSNLIIYCTDNELVDKNMKALPGKRFFTWSATGKAAAVQISASGGGTFNYQFGKQGGAFNLHFSDAASIENACHCLTLMLHLGYADSPAGTETIRQRMARLEPVAMRLELKEANNQCLLINDSYNSDLTSLTIALNFLEQQSSPAYKGLGGGRRTVILSDILQSGQSPRKLYGAVAKLLREKKINRFIGIGSEIEALQKLLDPGVEASFFKDTPDFLEKLSDLTFREETILLKGARRFEFEKIANRLASKVHKTTLEVNLTALLHNLRTYQGFLQPGVKMMVMVKAGAYGSGSIEVAKLLDFQHVDYLGVAYADEGVALRKAGIGLPIVVMNPEEATFEALLRHRLEPEIYSLSLLEKFLRFPDHGRGEISIHLKLDTGMHRLGFEEADLEEVLKLLSSPNSAPSMRQDIPHSAFRIPHSAFKVRSIFSHLAASEAVAHDDFTRHQMERFEKMYERLAAGLGYRPLRHILNSGGIVRFPQYQMDMVRLGIGMYGIDSSGLVQQRLQTVNTLKATISQIKKIAAGETVGYGRQGKAEHSISIATISLGYADGLLRGAGNGRYAVLIRGKKAPIVGSVCMDMTMVEVTDIPEAEEGDSVVIFGKATGGKDLPVEELANCLGTIPYEIFTTISERVKRVYVQE